MDDNRRSDVYSNPSSQLRYEAFARLQATAVAFGESLEIPEIVAIGGQSDGKSSLLEAFLGFRFNITMSEMGTRRPLIVQMVHDPTAKEPRCCLQDEDGVSYGEIIKPENLCDTLKERTETHLQDINAHVSSKPMVMRAEYAFSPNLTIIDTPGFVLKAAQGESDSTPQQILNIVKSICRPRHRLILFLQQSSVEWASSLWMHVLQDVDPSFSRTVFVCSKFDNRLAEISERWELEKYLSAAGYLPSNVKPFFVALPKDKSDLKDSSDWRKAIQATDRKIGLRLRNEIKGGFDEETFGGRIGFCNLRRFLEEELAARYREAAPTTLSLLQERCSSIQIKVESAEKRLDRIGDITALRRDAIQYTLSLASRMEAVMNGFGGAVPERHGLSCEEEKNIYVMPWPHGRCVEVKNSSLRLFGGAAANRVLGELKSAIMSIDLQPICQDTVANMLLAGHGRGDDASKTLQAAEELARTAARTEFMPLLDIAASHLGSILRRTYDIAAELETKSKEELVGPYVTFHARLRSSFQDFVNSLEKNAKNLLRHQLNSVTSRFSMATISDRTDAGSTENFIPTTKYTSVIFEGHTDNSSPEQGISKSCLKTLPNTESSPQPNDTLCLGPKAMFLTQMTVPETPSPEILSTKKDNEEETTIKRRQSHRLAISGRLGDASEPVSHRSAKMPRVTNNNAAKFHQDSLYIENHPSIKGCSNDYKKVYECSKSMFESIKHLIVFHTAPITLKASILEPLQKDLPIELCTKTVGLTDSDFMRMFATENTMNALKKERDELKRQANGWLKMMEEFEELAQTI